MTQADPGERLNSLITAYNENASTWTDRVKAQAEHEIWQAVCVVAPGVSRSRSWLNENLRNAPHGAIAHRAAMLRAGSWVAPLWEAIEAGKMSLDHASSIRRLCTVEAKRRGLGPADMPAALAETIERYGTSLRSGPAEKKPRHATGRKRGPQSAAAINSVQAAKALREAVSVAVTRYLEETLPENGMRVLAEQRFMLTLELGLDELKGFVGNSRSEAKALSRVGRTEFDQACAVLGVPAKWGKEINLKVVQRAWRDLKVRTHPDRNGGSNDKLGLYQQADEMYDIMVRYHEQHARRREPDAST